MEQKKLETTRLILKREIARPTELSRLFFNELSEQTIYAESSQPLQPGQQVEVRLCLDPNEIPLPKSRTTIPFHGVVSRTEGFGVIIKLDHSHMEQIREIKILVDSVSRNQPRQNIRKTYHRAHNVKHRRHSQFWLILILLGAVVVWAYFFYS